MAATMSIAGNRVFDSLRIAQNMPPSRNHLQQRVLATVRRHHMVQPGDAAGIAVSGGADSVALLRIMQDLRSRLGIRLLMVHFNHQLRGAESDADEKFVSDLAQKQNLEFISGTEDVAAWARNHACNLEDAARKCRYGFFSELIRGGRITRICVGHTADDQAETVLAKIIRGSGPAGLGGIYPVAEFVTRPLIEIRRAELREFLLGEGQTWREDSTNLDESRLRAKIRARLLPKMEQDFQPAIVSHLNNLSSLARGDEEFWNALVEQRFSVLVTKQKNVFRIAIDDLLNPLDLHAHTLGNQSPMVALTTRLIRRILQELKGDRAGFTSRHANDILHLATASTSGHEIQLLAGITVERSFDDLLFTRTTIRKERSASDSARETIEFHHAFSLESQSEQHVDLPEIGTRLCLKVIDWPAMARDTSLEQFVVNWNRLRTPAIVRNWLPGDSFRPQGRLRNRKLKHLMREKRIAPRDRRGWPVLTSGGEIVWARGFPVAQKFIAEKDTRKVLAISEEPL
jgi:tRNA(Ile)-lysidine synthase